MIEAVRQVGIEHTVNDARYPPRVPWQAGDITIAAYMARNGIGRECARYRLAALVQRGELVAVPYVMPPGGTRTVTVWRRPA